MSAKRSLCKLCSLPFTPTNPHLSLFRTDPNIIPSNEWTSRIIHLLNDQHMGMVSYHRSSVLCHSLLQTRTDPNIIPSGEWTSRIIHLLNDIVSYENSFVDLCFHELCRLESKWVMSLSCNVLCLVLFVAMAL